MKIKKIALVSVHSDPNYGSMLQAYALSTSLFRMGYDNEYINYAPYKERPCIVQFVINLVKRHLSLFNAKYSTTEYSYWRTKEFRNQRRLFQDFHDKYIKSSRQRYNKNTITEALVKYRKFVIGSDQTWSQLTTQTPYNIFFLDFVDEPDKKVSYAPSIGTVTISKSYMCFLVNKLKTFSFVSCRERQNVEILTKHLGKQVTYVLDPTFLLSKDNWLRLSEYIETPDEFVLCYILGTKECISEFAEKLGKEKSLPVYYIVTRPKYANNKNALKDVSVGQFLYLLNKAKYVVTDSFHGSILSINMGTNFFSFAKRVPSEGFTDNDRIMDFLKVVHLEHRFKADNDFSYSDDIDFDEVHKELMPLKEQSLNYLKKAVE